MNLRKYKSAIPYAIALPLAMVLLGGLLAITKNAALLPLGLIPALVLPYLAARKILSSPIRTAIFTVSPLLLLQLLGIIAFVITGVLQLIKSASPSENAVAISFTMLGSQILLGNIGVFFLVAVVAGWLAKITTRKSPKEEQSNHRVEITADADAHP